MSDNNPYQAPQSVVEPPPPSHAGGNMNWTIGGVLDEAWNTLSGFKLTMWGAMLMYWFIAVGIGVVFGFIGGEGNLAMEAVAQLVIAVVTWPLSAGLMMLGIKRAAGQPIQATMIFNYYSKTLPIVVMFILVMLLIALGLVLLVLPGVYLMIAYMFALPLLVEKNLGIWEAMETSRKAVSKCWFRMLGLMLLMTLIILISMIPFGIGLIWTLPMGTLVMGIVYRELFGVGEAVETVAQPSGTVHA